MEKSCAFFNSNRKVNLLISDSPDVINHLIKEPNLEDGCQILVVNINDKGFDCPGMLAEEKVLNDYDSYANSRTITRTNKPKNKSKKNDLDNSFEQSIKPRPDSALDRDDVRSRHDGSVGKKNTLFLKYRFGSKCYLFNYFYYRDILESDSYQSI